MEVGFLEGQEGLNMRDFLAQTNKLAELDRWGELE
jgi:hypothetical protein